MTEKSMIDPGKIECLTVSVPEAGTVLGLSRNGAYDAAKHGEIYTIRLGKKKRVPIAWLTKMLELP